MDGVRIIQEDKKIIIDDDELMHYGILTESGRYPWGSGERPYQRLRDWKSYVTKLKRSGVTEENIAKSCGMTVEELRDSLVSSSQKKELSAVKNAYATVENVSEAWRMKDRGMSNIAIAERMGVTEGTVRNWLKPDADRKARQMISIADDLRAAVDEKGYIDVGGGVAKHLGITETRMKAIQRLLKEEGYNIYYKKVLQAGTGKETTLTVLAKKDSNYREFSEAFKEDSSIVKSCGLYADSDSIDMTLKKVGKPVSVERSRIYVRYGDEGGNEMDGVIQIRPGVEDISLLDTKYAQVRIGVDDKMYMKGMAIYGYGKDIPDGYDIVYNVNKPRGTPDEKVFKPMYENGEDPFGAITSTKGYSENGEIIYQKDYVGKDGKQHQSALNIVNDQGRWEEWSKTIASQMLSKQSPDLAKQQLGLVIRSREEELSDILAYTNPTIKRKMLSEFAEACESDAVHLKAAALPRQKTQVILPINSLKESEIYAPNFNDGEKVVLIRYPHGGIFEVPELIVNNKNAQGQQIIGKTGVKGKDVDAVGIHYTVAQQLSGADFDGDNVIVIPNNEGRIKTSPYRKELQDFDPKIYKLPDNDPMLQKPDSVRKRNRNIEMGKVSNLITDMTIKGADEDEIIRAVMHSMVVIDSYKHGLDYKTSEKVYRIQELKDIYQPNPDGRKGGGASTIVSRSSAQARLDKRKEINNLDEMTPAERKRYKRGEKIYRNVNEEYEKKIVVTDPKKMTAEERTLYEQTGKPVYRNTGKIVKRQEKTTQMRAVDDARKLSSGTAIEEVYANHANELKDLANRARAAFRSTDRLQTNPSAKKTYAKEVAELNDALLLAEKNRPIERQAQLIQNAIVQAQVKSNPSLEYDNDALKKVRNKALTYAREAVGANKKSVQINITDRQWEAIQNGAISDSKLERILNNTDMDVVKKRATPRETKVLSDSMASRVRSLARKGLTQAEIAEALGISTSTISKVLT